MSDTIITKVIPVTTDGSLIFTEIKAVQNEVKADYNLETLSTKSIMISTTSDKLLIHFLATKIQK